MAKGDFDAVAKRFDDKMSAALSADRLRSTWATLEGQAGKFQRHGAAVSHTEGDYLIVVVPCEFAGASLDTKIAYDADDKIGGLFFLPHTAPAAAYVAPDYVNEGAIVERELTINSGALALGATLTLPRGNGSFPAVVLVHGSGPHDRDETIGPNRVFRDLALGIASHGVAVLRYEKRTHAHPESFKSNKFTVDDETVDDALAAVALLRTVKEIDSARIYIGGHSLGAMMAPRIGQRDKRIAGLILLAPPARPLEDIVIEQQNYLAKMSGKSDDKSIKDAIAALEHQRDQVKHLDAKHIPAEPLMLNLPAEYWLDLRDYDPVAVAKASRQPVLVLQGARDFQVTAPDFARWKTACAGNANVRCKSYEALNHLFIAGVGPSTPKEYDTAGHVAPQVIADIAQWINSPPVS